MKKKLLFAIDSLGFAGAEKSLVTLLNRLDYTRFEVDLLLFAHGNFLEKLLPKEVRILEPLKYSEFSKLSLPSAVFRSLAEAEIGMLASRLSYSLKIRRGGCTNTTKARLFWMSAGRHIEPNPKAYDVAISYAQGVPTFYVAEKVQASKKLAWVNVSYRPEGIEKEFQRRFYERYDRIVAVSESTESIFLETFPECRGRTGVIYDINDPDIITGMAGEGGGYDDGFDGIRLLTIGRLNHQKGYDIAIAACKKLKDSGLNFRWYALGKGPLQDEIEAAIRANGLEDHFRLLGVKANPYPYIRQADIYVQTSRFEGFGLAIAEARMLNVPVVTTRFDAVFNQMVHGKNGLVVDMNADAVCEGVLALARSPELREAIKAYLRSEKKGNVEEIHKFYQIVG